MKKLWRSLLRGLVVVGPIGLTLYIVRSLVVMLDDVLGGVLREVLPAGWYVTGMGLALAVVLIVLVGMLLDSVLVRAMVDLAEELLERLPLVKTIYGSLRDLAGFFASSRQAQGARQVVLVKLGWGATDSVGAAGSTTTATPAPAPTPAPAGDVSLAPPAGMAGLLPGAGVLGLVTRDDLREISPTLAQGQRVAVYVPLSYAWGGITLLVPRRAIEPVDMTVEEALRFAVTAGMSAQNTTPAQTPGSSGNSASPGAPANRAPETSSVPAVTATQEMPRP